jgi:hypothetical protein
VVDTLNPLEHIPFVSTLFDAMTGHTPSSGAQLAGGTLLGGPIGFVASLVNVIFQDETGKGVGGTMLAALGAGAEDAPTQLASIDPVQTIEVPESGAAAVEISAVETGSITSNETSNAIPANKNNPVLDLYGGSAASAHRSYQKAQLRPYLNDVTVSKVL